MDPLGKGSIFVLKAPWCPHGQAPSEPLRRPGQLEGSGALGDFGVEGLGFKVEG